MVSYQAHNIPNHNKYLNNIQYYADWHYVENSYVVSYDIEWKSL